MATKIRFILRKTILSHVKYFVLCQHFDVNSALSGDVAAASIPALWRQLALFVSSLPHLNSSAHTTANTV